MRRRFFYYIISLFVAVITGGCDDNDNPSEQAVLYDIVCLTHQDEAGAVFTLSRPDDATTVTLTSRQRVNTEAIPVGNRLLLMYIPDNGKAYTSGEVTVKGYGRIVNGVLTEVDDIPDGWDNDPVYLLSAWTSECYLNLHLRLPYDETPRLFQLAIPATQVDPSHPDIYLVHSLDADVNTFSRAYYASFDITQLIADPTVTGFTLHLNNANLPVDAINFDK